MIVDVSLNELETNSVLLGLPIKRSRHSHIERFTPFRIGPFDDGGRNRLSAIDRDMRITIGIMEGVVVREFSGFY